MKVPCSGCGRALTVNQKSRPEPTCHECRASRRAQACVSERRTPLKPCGTIAAYRRHVRRREQPCRPCADARNAYERRYAKTAPAVRAEVFCAACDVPLPKGHSKFCSETCRRVKLSSRVWPKICTSCRKPFIARNPVHRTCGEQCKAARRAVYDRDRVRWKHSRRRAAKRMTDITPGQEAEMRRWARKCPLCGVFMTGRPRLPNSKELDHIVPVGVGGTHTHGNVRIICRTCNLKRPKDGSDYMGPVTLWAYADA